MLGFCGITVIAANIFFAACFYCTGMMYPINVNMISLVTDLFFYDVSFSAQSNKYSLQFGTLKLPNNMKHLLALVLKMSVN